MMNLYIKLLSGKPVDHPITEDNMKSAYSHVDLDNLPVDWAKFIRVPKPAKLGKYEIAECVYEMDDGVVKDVWYIYPMSEHEKKLKQEMVKKTWAEDNGPSNWIFNEEKCCFEPPIPMPDDGKNYIWVQSATAWVEVRPEPIPEHNRPPYPTDGKLYDYNELQNIWIVRT